ncbi:cell envelope integrity protein TolA [Flavobacterium sp. 20NA77.7]|uniref:Cell envelope integrity protein TolA n=1 Tax=Flavobacterium nakdongensis TaxID=3073563 RepID=A0ABY9RB51_9FLAO|nr:cell envelope integrity protein TolA [Flavobacterium sp. 20NA77.7]WMW78196.1 cell envelope integrity protein TolA [Flavobacterium sp. 20NA77.7]
MNKIILYISIAIISVAGKLVAQEKTKTFETRAKEIAQNITTIKTEEKRALKEEVEAIDKQIEEGKITKEKGAEIKAKIATERASNIETKVAAEEAKLRELVNEHVEEVVGDSLKGKYSISIPGGYKNGKKYANTSEKRTTGQTVFAFGANNVLSDGNLAHSDFYFLRSNFYEWGYTWNTRLSNQSNLAHFKYGFSVMYNELNPTQNRIFATNGQTTGLVAFNGDLKMSKLRNVNLVFPMHFEIDFSKTNTVNDKKIFRSHKGLRLGIGGFAGFNLKTKQKICYEIDGNEVTEKTKGDFNVNDFVYGVSSYIGYKQTSLYVKYDLNPVFTDNAIKQNNISMGIRFDWN